MAVRSLTLFMKARSETMMNDLDCLFMQTRACTLMNKKGKQKKKRKKMDAHVNNNKRAAHDAHAALKLVQ